jgi:26S proteasome regulatory subunit N2
MAANVTLPAAGLLSLLDESEASLQAYALDNINRLIDTFWAEVADEVVKM